MLCENGLCWCMVMLCVSLLELVDLTPGSLIRSLSDRFSHLCSPAMIIWPYSTFSNCTSRSLTVSVSGVIGQIIAQLYPHRYPAAQTHTSKTWRHGSHLLSSPSWTNNFGEILQSRHVDGNERCGGVVGLLKEARVWVTSPPVPFDEGNLSYRYPTVSSRVYLDRNPAEPNQLATQNIDGKPRKKYVLSIKGCQAFKSEEIM